MKYKIRYFDDALNDALSYAGAVLIVGPKFCGKTTSALKASNSHIAINVNLTADLITINPELALEGKTPHLIDEWQIVPDIWNYIKNEIDKNYEPGRFILTGSATPADKSQILHSGAGRIIPIYMRPMSLYESEDSDGSVSLNDLFEEKSVIEKFRETESKKICHLICRGGWPLAALMKQPKDIKITKGYFKNLFNFSETGDKTFRNKKPEIFYAVMKSYARNVSTEASNSTIRADIEKLTQQSVSEKTLAEYIEALRDLFIIEDMPAWNPHIKSKTSIRSKVTRHFVDPSFASCALGVNETQLERDGEALGLFFEDLAVRDLRIYSQALGGEVRHYRDNTGLECDSIILLEDGRWAAVEIKLGGPGLIEEGAKNLLRLKNKIKKLSSLPEPSFLMVLCAWGPTYQRPDGVVVTPVTSLKAY